MHVLRRARPLAAAVGLAVAAAATGCAPSGPVATAGSVANAINNQGWVVGSMVNGRTTSYAFLAKPGAAVVDVAPNWNSSEATDVNDAGTVVGYAQSLSFDTRAFRWTAGEGMRPLAQRPTDTDVEARAVNAKGTIIGVAQPNERSEALVWRWDAAPVVLSFPGATSTVASGINDRDEIVGSARNGSGTTPVLWLPDPQAGTWTPVALPDEVGAVPSDINNAGTIIGTGYRDDRPVAVRWMPGDRRQVRLSAPAPPADPMTRAERINEKDVVIGTDIRGLVVWRLRPDGTDGGPVLFSDLWAYSRIDGTEIDLNDQGTAAITVRPPNYGSAFAARVSVPPV